MNYLKLLCSWLMLFGLLSINESYGQELEFKPGVGTNLNSEIRLQIDNDRFYFSKTDQYYTSGIHLSYRQRITDSLEDKKLLNSLFPKEKSVFWGIQAAQRIYTPKDISEQFLENFDRPYAGWLFLKGSVDLLYNNKSSHSISLDLGVTGPKSGAEGFQNWWHNKTNITMPEGWENQISESPSINLTYNFKQALVLTNSFEIESSSEYSIGTLFHHLQQDFNFKLGHLGSYGQSSFLNYSDGHLELYAFVSPGLRRVFYNGLIQGNWIGEESPHTMIKEPWVFQLEYGVFLGFQRVGLSYAVNRMGKETNIASDHTFARIKCSVKF